MYVRRLEKLNEGNQVYSHLIFEPFVESPKQMTSDVTDIFASRVAMYVCVYACISACVYVFMSVFMSVYTYVCGS